jgi:hypothetical protein
MDLPNAPIAHQGFFACPFITVKDQEKSRDFYVRILGGKLIKPENPCYIKLENTWIILNCGGGPTPDKPEVVLETPSDLNRVNGFLNLRVADIWACYKEWRVKGAFLLPSHCPIPTLGMAPLHARSRRLHHRGRPVYATRHRLVQ